MLFFSKYHREPGAIICEPMKRCNGRLYPAKIAGLQPIGIYNASTTTKADTTIYSNNQAKTTTLSPNEHTTELSDIEYITNHSHAHVYALYRRTIN